MHIQNYAPLRVYSHNLWGFSLLLRENNTFPFIRGYEFMIEGEITPTLTTLQDLLPGKNIQGSLEAVDFKTIQDKITHACSLHLQPDGSTVQVPYNDLIEARTTIFWSSLDRYKTLPPDNCFIHYPADNSYFADTTLWSFCFILTKKTTDNLSHGLLIYGKTWNSAAACEPESVYEEFWRKQHFMFE